VNGASPVAAARLTEEEGHDLRCVRVLRRRSGGGSAMGHDPAAGYRGVVDHRRGPDH